MTRTPGHAAQMEPYFTSLVAGDAVAFKFDDENEHWAAFFIRREGKAVVVKSEEGRSETRVAQIKFVRACCKCGCTDLYGCDGGCAWFDIKTCTSCATPKRKKST